MKKTIFATFTIGPAGLKEKGYQIKCAYSAYSGRFEYGPTGN